jgi:predicted ATPase
MKLVRRDLPSGTVTFFFSDVEGSTRLLHDVGAAAYADALAEHRRILRRAFRAHGGVEVDTQGDAFFVAFASATDALDAASEALAALARGPIRVRIGIHSGTGHVTQEGYVGEDVHKGARIAAAGHGGQVLLSKETRELVAVEVQDLGEHRLKDFAELVWIFQLGAEHFPPLKTISNTNLPRPASSFVGREREVAEVLANLRDGARLLSLTGPGGSGKTRLALEAAADLVPDFRNGVFWVGLAPLGEAALVADTIAQTIGARDSLADHIEQRELLLLLDNFEQVIEAAPELASLVERCPNLRLLVTSRERLRVRGEVEYPVLPLAQPEAVALFCARAGLEPDGTVAELCRRLDSLPLAVELAAVRTSVLSPPQILERLSQRLDLLRGGRDAEARQATLRATLVWSYELLDEQEKRLFARLAVFAGGCTLDAAEKLAEADLDTLQSLVDKSLLRHTDERFWMLETIREYALERLEESGEGASVRRSHAGHFLALAQEAEPHLRQESSEWLERLVPEHDNVRAALDHLETTGEHELALLLAAAVWWFWSLSGNVQEGRRRLERVLASDERPTATRAYALMGAADLALDTGDKASSRLFGEEALAQFRMLEERWGAAFSLLILGLISAFEDDWPKAQPRFEESARLFGELADEHWTLQAIRRLAWSYEELGDLERARAIQEEMLRRARASGDEFLVAKALSALAQYALDEGRVDDAVLFNLEEAHRIYRGRRSHHDRYWDAILVCRFARALALEGRAAVAAQLLACFESLVEEMRAESGSALVESWVVRMNEVTLTAIRDRLDKAAIAEAWEQGRALTADEAVALALDSLG